MEWMGAQTQARFGHSEPSWVKSPVVGHLPKTCVAIWRIRTGRRIPPIFRRFLAFDLGPPSFRCPLWIGDRVKLDVQVQLFAI